MSDLGPQYPIDTMLVAWLVKQNYVSYAGLIKIRQALTDEEVLLGFPVQLFEAREELLAKVDVWIAEIEERIRNFDLGSSDDPEV